MNAGMQFPVLFLWDVALYTVMGRKTEGTKASQAGKLYSKNFPSTPTFSATSVTVCESVQKS